MAAAVAPSIGRTGTRPGVIWVGTIPDPVSVELSQRNLRPSSANIAGAVTAITAGVRAVLIPYSKTMRPALAELFYPALDRGILLAVVLTDSKSAAADRATATTIISSIKRKNAEGMAGAARIRSLNGWNPSEVAEACASHDPGRDANPVLVIHGSPVPDSSHSLLLSRAFTEFSRISLTPLPGGFTKSLVWMVDAYHPNGWCCEPFVVKAGDRRAITTEVETTRDQVLDYVPFPNRPPLLEDRCVDGATERLLVSMFVKSATRFDSWLCLDPPRAPIDRVVESLFKGALGGWRSQGRQETLQFGSEFRKYGYFGPKTSEKESLQPAYDLAIRGGLKSARPPGELLEALYALPPIATMTCHSHGDLHIRNVFVRPGSDVVMIDFRSARYKSPMSRDPATFEVSLAFHQIDCLKQIPGDTLLHLYTSPLLGFSTTADDDRLAAIKAVRRLARSNGAEERDYAVTVASTLLQLVRFPPQGTDQRGLAYALADNLVRVSEKVP